MDKSWFKWRGLIWRYGKIWELLLKSAGMSASMTNGSIAEKMRHKVFFQKIIKSSKVQHSWHRSSFKWGKWAQCGEKQIDPSSWVLGDWWPLTATQPCTSLRWFRLLHQVISDLLRVEPNIGVQLSNEGGEEKSGLWWWTRSSHFCSAGDGFRGGVYEGYHHNESAHTTTTHFKSQSITISTDKGLIEEVEGWDQLSSNVQSRYNWRVLFVNSSQYAIWSPNIHWNRFQRCEGYDLFNQTRSELRAGVIMPLSTH